ncbi:MAG TPA: flavoprotein [Ktedonosporobacter sp.]|jgi:phosphopantothenoylcysteine synthetase/decarboxylase|nr:flavoprotein [Ktedonosporobacter sp.]
MTKEQSYEHGVLYVIACASPTAELVPHLVTQAQADGWKVCVIVTPQGTKFVDLPLLESLTGYPVRSEYKHPDAPDVLPRADAIVVFPATFNTLNKWALGITDTLALGLLCEYTGFKMPIVAVPGILSASGLDTHPAFLRSMRMLRRHGVHVLYRPDLYPPKNQVPPAAILETLYQVMSRDSSGGL